MNPLAFLVKLAMESTGRGLTPAEWLAMQLQYGSLAERVAEHLKGWKGAARPPKAAKPPVLPTRSPSLNPAPKIEPVGMRL